MSANSTNYWPDDACAKAFWGQQDIPPYHQLLADTVEWVDPQPGQTWLDLGCGGGRLTAALWEKSGGELAEIVALDCAAVNEKAIARFRETAQPPVPPDRVRFLHADFSRGLATLPDASFDGVISGLAIQYAESRTSDGWNSSAYDRLLVEIGRVLRPGGTFVFSVNVPEPAWGRVALYGFPAVFRTRRPLKFLKNALRMLRYGSWLKREARRGRFHYLPRPAVLAKLEKAGFTDLEARLSFAGQAYVFRCRRPW